MTDITDQDRRDAREWAEDVAETFKYDDEVPRETRAAVNYILATVDAPEPTLAEEILDAAARIRDAVTPGDRDVSWADMESCADRAAQMEHDLAESRAEVERLTAELETETVAREENVAADQQANTQGTLASSLPDLADVPYGEAWLVEYHGDDLPALRRLDHPGDWYLVRKNGTGGHVRSQDITLVSRLVPAPRQITTRGELNALPEGTVVRAKGELVCERYRHRSKGLVWISTGVDEDFPVDRPAFPATVLYEPEVAS